jgi:hypothetical protein
MKSRLMLLAALLSLGACSESGDNPYHASNQQRIVGEGMSVSIVNARNEEDARPFADQYCNRLGRAAEFKQMTRYRYSRTTTNSASFDCVPRPT